MKKITLKAKREFVKHKLHTNPVWAKTALLRIFELQTDDEKYYESTRDANGVGFTGADGEILSSFAKHLENTFAVLLGNTDTVVSHFDPDGITVQCLRTDFNSRRDGVAAIFDYLMKK